MTSHHIKVGIAGILALLLLAYGAWYVSGTKLKQRKTYPMTVEFDNVQGLEAEAAVRLAGVNVGWVKSVGLLPNGRAALQLAIFEGIKIPKGSDFTIQVGFLQDKILDIKIPPPGMAHKYYKPGARIKQTVSPTTIDDMMVDAKSSLTRANRLLDSLDSLVADKRLKANVLEITDNIRATTEETMQLAKMLKEAGLENRENITATVSNIRSLTEHLNVTADKVDVLMDNANGYLGDKEIKTDFKDIVEKLRNTADNLEQSTKTLKDLSTDDQVKDDIKETIHKTRETMDDAQVAFSGVSRFVKSMNSTEVKPWLEFRYVSHEDKYHMDMSLRLFPPARDVMYLLGLTDVGESSNTDLMVGVPGEGNYWFRFGLKAGKLGMGFDREANNYLFVGDLIDPNDLRFNFRVGKQVRPNLYMMMGVEQVLKKNWLSLGVVRYY